MSTSRQYAVTAVLDGQPLGVFDSFSGGGVDSEELKYRPGGMAEEISLGGQRMVENVTIARLYDLVRDHAQVPQLIARVGKGEVVVSKQPLDTDGNVFGRPLVYRGKLKRVTPPEHDSTSNDAATIELEVSTVSQVA